MLAIRYFPSPNVAPLPTCNHSPSASKGKKVKPVAAGAKQPAKPTAQPGDKTRSLLQDMKKDLLAIKEMLEKK